MRSNRNIREEFEYLEDDQLPVLMLGIRIWPEYPESYTPVENGLQWRGLVHQTAGHACHHHYIFGTTLPVTPQVLEKMKSLADRYIDSQISMPAVLNTIIGYQSDIKSLFGDAVNCNDSHSELEEAIYPIDCTKEALAALTTTKLPDELDDLIKWSDDLEQLCGMIGRWRLYILGENSD